MSFFTALTGLKALKLIFRQLRTILRMWDQTDLKRAELNLETYSDQPAAVSDCGPRYVREGHQPAIRSGQYNHIVKYT